MYFFLYCIQLFLVSTLLLADRVRDKIYFDVSGSSFCFRLFNATHQAGCGSGRSGANGQLHFVSRSSDMQSLPDSDTILFFVNQSLLTPENAKVIISNENIVGAIVDFGNSSEIPESGWSADQQCPNHATDLYMRNGSSEYDCATASDAGKAVNWNTVGTAIRLMDFGDKPIVGVSNASEIKTILDNCLSYASNANAQKCGGKILSFQLGSMSTPLCMERTQRWGQKDNFNFYMFTSISHSSLYSSGHCSPVKGLNFITPMRPNPLSSEKAERKDKSVYLLVVRLDSFSLLEDFAGGADTPVISVVTALVTSQLIAMHSSQVNWTDKDIMIAFFDGESFDYIGSSGFIYDIESDKYPSEITKIEQLKLSHIAAIIELGQLAHGSNDIYLHTDPLSYGAGAKEESTKDIVDEIRSKFINLKYGKPKYSNTVDTPLPPSSLHSFLRKSKIPNVLLADHDKSFRNKYYNSRFDTLDSLGVKFNPDAAIAWEEYTDIGNFSCLLAQSVARVMLQLIDSNFTEKIQADELTCSRLLYCFGLNQSCPLFMELLPTDTRPKDVIENFSKRKFLPSASTRSITFQTLAWSILQIFTGTNEVNITSKEDCKRPESISGYNFTYDWFPAKPRDNSTSGVCYRHLVQVSYASSPAFILKDGDSPPYDSYEKSEYSTWTESVWQTSDDFSLQVYLIPSALEDVVTITVGALTVVFWFLFVFMIRRRSNVLFAKCSNRDDEFQSI